MPKDKPPPASTKKAAAKAHKKAKAAQKTARKEKKKATKSQRDDHDQDEDLQDILEKVFLIRICPSLISIHVVFPVDETRMGGSTHRHRRACARPSQQTCKRHADPVSKRKSPLVHRRRVL